MKITQTQQDYVFNVIKALEGQFNSVEEGLRETINQSEEDFSKFTGYIAQMVFDGTVEEDILKLPKRLQKQHFDTINSFIQQTFKDEYAREHRQIQDTLLEKAINLDLYREMTLNSNFNMESMPDTNKYLSIVNTEVDGKLWSDRLWTNKALIQDTLMTTIKKLGMGHITIADAKRNIQQAGQRKSYETARLVRNELARVQSQVNEEFDKSNNVQWQLFMATLDNRTSSMCKTLDGKTYRIDDKNKPIPPLGTHVNCRSTLVGIPDKDWRPKSRRDKRDGKNEIIPYETWKTENEVTVINNEVQPNITKPISEMSYKELEAKAKTMNIIFGDEDGEDMPTTLPIELIRSNLEWHEKLLKKYPNLANHKMYYGESSRRENIMGACNVMGEMRLNKKHYTQERVTDLLTDKDTKLLASQRRWSSPTTSPINSTYVHELGHYVSLIRSKQEKISWDAYVKKIRNEVNKEYAKITGYKPKGKDFEKLISEYGGTSTHESFAEAFQEAYNYEGPYTELTKESEEYNKVFKKILDKEMKKL